MFILNIGFQNCVLLREKGLIELEKIFFKCILMESIRFKYQEFGEEWEVFIEFV